MSNDRYADTVVLLRDIGEKYEVADSIRRSARDLRREDPSKPIMDAINESFDEADGLSDTKAALVDHALRALEQLYYDYDYDAALDAMDEASAAWLRRAILKRAIDALESEDAD